MTHLPFIAAAYGLTVAAAIWLGAGAAFRLARARRRLAAYEAQAGSRRPARAPRPTTP